MPGDVLSRVIIQLSEFFEEELFIPELRATTKDAVLKEMVEALVATGRIQEGSILLDMLRQRETLGSTGIGDGVAIPHGKFHGITHPIIAFGRSRKGLDFESMDGEPVFLFFLLVAPENSASIHLKALAKIAKILKNSAFRKVLIGAPGKKELYQTIIQNDEDF